MAPLALVGKTIARVDLSTGGGWNVGREATTIDRIEFTDGTALAFHVLESSNENGYGVEVVLLVPRVAPAVAAPVKPTRNEYRAHVFAAFTANSAHDARGLRVHVAADDVDALVADARARGLDVRDVVRNETGRAQIRIFSFRRGDVRRGGAR